MAERGDEPPLKKSRHDTVYTKFHSCSFDEKFHFCKSYKQLCIERFNSLVSLEISYCDANAENGKTFSRATCHAKPVIKELYPFGSIFGRGVRILNNILRDDEYTPDNVEDKKLLTPLLTYLFDESKLLYHTGSHKCLKTIQGDVKNETEVMTRLATHFFSKLSVSKSFMIDKNAPNEGSKCSCLNSEEKDFLDYFGDTSIGNKDVWHGTLDIILDNSGIGVCLAPETEVTSPGGGTSVEIKCNGIGATLTRDLALAQTITFAFLQKQRHSLMTEHCLIPYILASRKEVQYFFYDPDNDILLQSRKYPLFVTVGDKVMLSYQTIISAWLVLNYKYLCTGPTKYILEAPKSGFPKFAGGAIDIYKSNLKFQNVCDSSGERFDHLYDPIPAIYEGRLDSCPFKWPEEPFVSCPFDVV